MFFAATTASPARDWRNEYDKLLFELIEEQTRRADHFLVELQRQYNEYKEGGSKNKDLLARVEREVEFSAPLVNRSIESAETELKRTDLDQIERYLYEKLRDEAKILQKHFNQLAVDIKKP